MNVVYTLGALTSMVASIVSFLKMIEPETLPVSPSTYFTKDQA